MSLATFGSAFVIQGLSRSANRLGQFHALRVRTAIFGAPEEAELDRNRQEGMLDMFSAIVLGSAVVTERMPSDERDMAMSRARVERAFGRGPDMLIQAIELESIAGPA